MPADQGSSSAAVVIRRVRRRCASSPPPVPRRSRHETSVSGERQVRERTQSTHFYPLRRMIWICLGLGVAYPEKDALSPQVTPRHNTERPLDKLNAKTCPSNVLLVVSSYIAKGFFEPNRENALHAQQTSRESGGDGSITVRFGGCDGKTRQLPPAYAVVELLVRLSQVLAKTS